MAAGADDVLFVGDSVMVVEQALGWLCSWCIVTPETDKACNASGHVPRLATELPMKDWPNRFRLLGSGSSQRVGLRHHF